MWWHTVTHGRGMQWVASILHTTSEHGVSIITTADAHTSAASSRLNWSPCRFKWTRPFRRKTKSGFCACAVTFSCLSLSRKESVYVLCCVNARVRVTDVCWADSKSEVVDTHTHLGTKIAPGMSWNRVCTEPGGTGFRSKIRWSRKITRKAFFKK